MSNSARHRVRVDINKDGTFSIWNGNTIVNAANAHKLTRLMLRMQKSADIVDFFSRSKPHQKQPITETVDEYLDRGGLITKVVLTPPKRKLSDAESASLSLASLGLG